MKMPSASAPMLFAVPSSTARLPYSDLMPAARSCLVSVTFGAPPAVEVMMASGLAAFTLERMAVQSVASIGAYSSPTTLPPTFSI